MIACIAELFVSVITPAEDAGVRPAPAVPAVVELTIGAAATTAAVLPVFLGFAEPVKRGAAARILMRQMFGVIVCGALLALGNWIFTQCSKQWVEAGLPADLPLLIPRSGGGGTLPNGQSPPGGSVRSAGASSSSAAGGEPWYTKYTD